MTGEQAAEALRAGQKLAAVVGSDPDDPVLRLSVWEGMVIYLVNGGWSAGTVEPLCNVDSDYLQKRLGEYLAVVVDDEALQGAIHELMAAADGLLSWQRAERFAIILAGADQERTATNE